MDRITNNIYVCRGYQVDIGNKRGNKKNIRKRGDFPPCVLCDLCFFFLVFSSFPFSLFLRTCYFLQSLYHLHSSFLGDNDDKQLGGLV